MVGTVNTKLMHRIGICAVSLLGATVVIVHPTYV
jgi:hypothetical protein